MNITYQLTLWHWNLLDCPLMVHGKRLIVDVVCDDCVVLTMFGSFRSYLSRMFLLVPPIPDDPQPSELDIPEVTFSREPSLGSRRGKRGDDDLDKLVKLARESMDGSPGLGAGKVSVDLSGSPVIRTKKGTAAGATAHLVIPFLSLDKDGDGAVDAGELIDLMESTGIRPSDPRAYRIFNKLKDMASDGTPVDFNRFARLSKYAPKLVSDILKGDLTLPDFPLFKQELMTMYERAARERRGKIWASRADVASKAETDMFAMAACSVSGQRVAAGDVGKKVVLSGVSAPVMYSLAMNQWGEEFMHGGDGGKPILGREPSGLPDDDLTLNPENRPHNPMMVSGNLLTSSMVWTNLSPVARVKQIEAVFDELAGTPGAAEFSDVEFGNMMQQSARTLAIAYHMNEKKCFSKLELEGVSVKDIVQMYFRTQSIRMDMDSLSVVASTLANGGVCPLTGKRVFAASIVRAVLSQMFSCGHGRNSGAFAFEVGLPSVASSSGVIILVIPTVMGVAVASPRLRSDAVPFSHRGLLIAEEFVRSFSIHNFDLLAGLDPLEEGRRDPTRRLVNARAKDMFALFMAARDGDLNKMLTLQAGGVPMDLPNYDGRTVMHAAAAEGKLAVVEWLAKECIVDVNSQDRWGKTPLDDANQFSHVKTAAFLVNRGGKSGKDLPPMEKKTPRVPAPPSNPQ